MLIALRPLRVSPAAVVLLVGSLCLSLGALFAREAHAQDGQVVMLELPVSGTHVLVMPPGNSAWQPIDINGKDGVISTMGPQRSVSLSSHPEGSCNSEWLGGVSLPGGATRRTTPPYLADNFFPIALEGQNGDQHMALMCADRERGFMTIVAVSKAPLDQSAATLKGLLESIGRSFDTRREEPPTTGDGPSTLILPALGATVTLPGPWRVETQKLEGAGNFDVLRRLDPSKPRMSINLKEWTSSRCDGWEATSKRDGLKGSWRDKPGYLPAGFHPATLEHGDDVTKTALVCVDLEQTAMVAMIIHAGPLGHPAIGEARDALRLVAVELGASLPAAIVAPPPTPPPSPSPSPTPSPSPSPTPPSDDDDDWDFDSDFRGADPMPGLELRVGYLNAEGFEGAVGFVFHFTGGALLPEESIIGLGASYNVSLGVNTDGNVPFDAMFGIGPGLRLGPVNLIPVVGLGVDTMGAGGDYDMDAAFYWYPHARLRLGFDSFALEGVGGYTFRGNIVGDAASDVPNQIRVESRVYILPWDDAGMYLGFHWTDMSRRVLDPPQPDAVGNVDATYIGGLIGIGAFADD